MGLKMMLKALGVNITDEQIEQLETMLPKLPVMTAAALQHIELLNERLIDVQTRLERIEVQFARRSDGPNNTLA